MSTRRNLIPLGVAALIAAALGLLALTDHYVHLPERVSDMETLVIGQDHYVPGSQAALRVVVRDTGDGAAIADAAVEVALRPTEGGRAISLYRGTTDRQGSAEVSFTVPEGLDPAQALIVETSSPLGKDRLEKAITVDRDYKILITTDKPIYQPGQVIHLRALALSAFDLRPAAEQSLEFIVADGKGIKVYRQMVETSPFGVASSDFQLASEVNTGAYKVVAQMGRVSSEVTVTVERYVLPKFAVEVTTERGYYLPGEAVAGSLHAAYFFGKPVAGAEVRIEGFTFDFERQDWVDIQGQTDENGDFAFAFDLPPYLVGSDLEGGVGRFYLQTTVRDQTEHSEESSLSLPVAQSRLVIKAVPESGTIRKGVENIVYILTAYPDGTPAETDLRVMAEGRSRDLKTGAYGLAEFRITPQSAQLELQINARDAQGNAAEAYFALEGDWQEEAVLLRPDRAAYRVGETMHLDVITSSPSGLVYLDIVRQGQTVSTRSTPVEAGHASVAVDLTPDLFGTLELHAYKILPSGTITRDTRLVVVDAPEGLNLTLTPDAEEHRPGETAVLDVQVDGQDGTGAQAALGLTVVDESVFALAEQDPGFAKLYFTLEAELLQPKYEVHGFSVPDLIGGGQLGPELGSAVEGAAQASLAEAPADFTPALSSREEKIQRARERQTAYFSALAKGAFGLELLLPLGAVGLALVGLKRQRALARGLLLTGALLAVLVGAFLVAASRSPHGWGILDQLSYWISELIYGLGAAAGLLIVLAGLAGAAALGAYALGERDGPLGWMLLLTLAFTGTFGLLGFAALRADPNPSEAALIAFGLAILALPVAYFLRAGGFAARLQLGWSAAAVATGLLALIAGPSLLALGSAFGARQLGGPAMPGADVWMADAAFGLAEEEGAFRMTASAPPAEAPEAGEAGAQAEPPRLRQYFPETMFWQPEALTDESGHLRLELPLADSITTWRLTALASTQDGRLGTAVRGLRVFQDFFIDLDLPLALTQNDEVSVPVGIFNYLPEPQSVRLVLEPADWFELKDEAEKEVTIAGNEIEVVYFRIKALAFGRKALKVTAYGSRLSDAIQKEVTVHPDGKRIDFSQSDRLGDEGVSLPAAIPEAAIPGTQRLLVKIYPGVVSQVVEGLDSILRMPFGCFEQTSSTTYPNVLVLDYLQTTGQASPEVQFKAEEYINLGYQRLTTFEVGGSGGFSLFGDPPPDPMLTAYGLQEFNDMSRVHNVDPALIERIAEWLFSKQQGNGSWQGASGFHETSITSQTDPLPVTAFVVWGLMDAGFGDDARAQKGAAWLRESQSQAESAYVLALVANALVAADLHQGEIGGLTKGVLDRLAGMAQFDGEAAAWEGGVATFMGSEGQTGDIETTGLAALALLRAGTHPELANAALTYLVRHKDSFGTWYSTQATVVSLKALLESVRAGEEGVDATVTVTLNGGQKRELRVTPENFDVVQLVSFDDVLPGAENTVRIQVEGQGDLMYQIAGSYVLPWSEAVRPKEGAEPELITIDVAYDRAELTVDDTVQVDVTVTLNEPGTAEWTLLDLGIPPGFAVKTDDLNALVARFDDVPEGYAYPTVERYELTGRQILVYVENLTHEQPLSFSYRLQAKFPLVAQSPASNAYDYYNPSVRGEIAPVVLTVNP